MIGRWLCALGFHDWIKLEKKTESSWYVWVRCLRCHHEIDVLSERE